MLRWEYRNGTVQAFKVPEDPLGDRIGPYVHDLDHACITI